MARLPVIVMCPSSRAPPVPVRRLVSSATKSLTTQNAAYVPGHISSQFFEALGIKSLAGIGGGLRKRGNGNAAIFGIGNCILCTAHRRFSSHVSLVMVGGLGAHVGPENQTVQVLACYAAAASAAGSGAMPPRITAAVC